MDVLHVYKIIMDPMNVVKLKMRTEDMN